jgi:hypothetical protein
MTKGGGEQDQAEAIYPCDDDCVLLEPCMFHQGEGLARAFVLPKTGTRKAETLPSINLPLFSPPRTLRSAPSFWPCHATAWCTWHGPAPQSPQQTGGPCQAS